MTENLPIWPTKLTREQQRAVKEREKEFQLALKSAGRTCGWRYAGGGLFRQDSEWFASVMPSLVWERGALLRFSLKPMILDPLFWEIVGLPDNNRLPLSFRANGAWVLRPRSHETLVGNEESDPTRLARKAVDVSNAELLQSREQRSVERMLVEAGKDEVFGGQPQALAICLNILADNLNDALALCRSDSGATGGFMTGNRTFLDQARDWIVAKRRSLIAPV